MPWSKEGRKEKPNHLGGAQETRKKANPFSLGKFGGKVDWALIREVH